MASHDSTESTTIVPPPARPKRRWRWFQFGLRTLLILMLVFGTAGGFLSRWIIRVRRQSEIVDRLIADGFVVHFEHGKHEGRSRSNSPKNVRSLWKDITAWHDVTSVEKESYRGVFTPELVELVSELPRLEKLDIAFQDFHYGSQGTERAIFAHPLACAKRIQHLRVKEKNLQPSDADRIAECSGLTFLEVDVDETSNKELACFNRLKQLKTLRIRGPLAEEAVAKWQDLTQLEDLFLGGSRRLSSKTLADLIRRNPSLRRVELPNVHCSIEVCEALAQCGELSQLILRDCRLDDETFALLGDTPQLVELDIQRARLMGTGFGSAGSFSRLVEVTAADSYIDDEGVRCLAQLPSLRSLNLTRTKITNLACEHLNGSKLTTLNLSGNQVTDRGIAALHCKDLETLNCAATHVSATPFALTVQWPKLRVLTLGRRAESEKELEAVLQIPSLEHLYADGPTGVEFLGRHSRRYQIAPSMTPPKTFDPQAKSWSLELP
jgi:hypothetical protein